MLTASIEFISDTKQHLETIEQQLRHIHNVRVNLVEPRVPTAPALISIDIHGDRGEIAQQVAQTLYNNLHDVNSQGQKHIFLVTIEGDRIDIEPLSVDEITNVILGAEAGAQ